MNNVFPTYPNGNTILVDEDNQYASDWTKYRPDIIAGVDGFRIRNMNSADCADWIKRYSGLQVYPASTIKIPKGVERIKLKPLRAKIVQRQKDIADAKRMLLQGQKLDVNLIRFRNHVDLEVNLLLDPVKLYSSQIMKETFANDKRNSIYDLATVPTGLWSVTMYTNYLANAKTKKTEEHCSPRTNGIHELVDWCMDQRRSDPDWELTCGDIVRWCFASVHTVWTTSEENDNLVKYQKPSTFVSTQASYESAGIEVVRVSEAVVPYAWQFVADRYDVDLSACNPPQFDQVLTLDELNDRLTSVE